MGKQTSSDDDGKEYCQKEAFYKFFYHEKRCILRLLSKNTPSIYLMQKNY